MSRGRKGVITWRQRCKQRAIVYKGGVCIVCGYRPGPPRTVTFHHLDPADVGFRLSDGVTRAWRRVKAELDKCVLLCIRCHVEVHEGYTDVREHLHKNPSSAKGDVLLATSPFSSFSRRQEQTRLKKVCPNCGGEKGPQAALCRKCWSRTRLKIDWPDAAKLAAMVEASSFLATGRQLGVSDNAVRKRLRNHPP